MKSIVCLRTIRHYVQLGVSAVTLMVLFGACSSDESTTPSPTAEVTTLATTAPLATQMATSADASTATASAPSSSTETLPDLATLTAAIQGAQWSDNVTISINGSTATFVSDGLPSHEILDAYLGDGPNGKFLAGGVKAYDARFTFPIVPTVSASPVATNNGAIGVAISGAVFFNPYEGNGTATVANDDNEILNGVPFIDACGGHPLPTNITYHYHGIPYCITDAVDAAGQHSVLIGYIFDGYPIFGPQGVDGTEPSDLDECMGHFGPTPEFPNGIYHYHVSSTANYITECYHGVSSNTRR